MPRKPKAERNEEPVSPANPRQPELRTIPITNLLPDEKNPRKDLQPADPEYQKIKTSIEQFQFLDPIVFNSRTHMIIGGHQRLKILKDSGVTDLFVLSLGAYSWAFSQADLTEMPPAMETAANIALNKASGDWDTGRLVTALESIKIEGLDINITGFNEKELVTFMADLNKGKDPLDAEPQISRAEELRKEWGTELGQLWQCGDHRVICGDCTDPAIVARLLRSGTPTAEVPVLMLTDPPYGISVVGGDKPYGKVGGGGDPKNGGYAYGGKKNTKSASVGTVGGSNILRAKTYAIIEGDESTDIARKAIELLVDIKNKIIFGGNYFTDFLPPSRCWIVWDKQNTGNFADAELAWTSFDKGVRLYHWLWNGLSRKGERAEELKSRIHPTQKPVGLFKQILEDFSNPNDIIIDPFLGSGVTLIACQNTSRVCRGAEISPDYIAVTLQRYRDVTGYTPVLVKE
jgi:hypothetical protein